MSNFPDDIDAHVESYGGWLDLGESDSQASLLTPSKVTIADTNLKGKSVKVQYTESGERFWVEVIHHDVETGGLYGLVANDLVQTPLDAWHPIFFHVFHVREVQLFEEADLAAPGKRTWRMVRTGKTEDLVSTGYTGDTNSVGLPHGSGTIEFPDGSTYVGEFKDGKQHGKGVVTEPDGTEYDGEWKDGLPSGQGRWTFNNGCKYIGECQDQEFNGTGTFIWPNGSRYVVEWKDGRENGQGTYTDKYGSSYYGQG